MFPSRSGALALPSPLCLRLLGLSRADAGAPAVDARPHSTQTRLCPLGARPWQRWVSAPHWRPPATVPPSQK